MPSAFVAKPIVVEPVAGAEAEEAKAAPAKRKVKLVDIVNDFEEFIKKSAAADEDVLKKYGIEPAPDTGIEA